MTRWFEKTFDRTTAIEFFQQLASYSYEFVVNRDAHIASLWPNPNPGMMHSDPVGAILHPSNSRYLWSSIKNALNPTLSTHFVVARKFHDVQANVDHYPLVRDLPTTVLSPHPWRETIQHSGWISGNTVGIELCNCGMLRAARTIVLHPSDYDPIRFAMNEENNSSKYKFYWAANAWREEFDGDVYIDNLHGYEVPPSAQLESMLVILRALDEIHNLDPALILPSSCVGQTPKTMPFINFDELRLAVKYRSDIDVHLFGATASSRATYPEEGDTYDDEIEGLVTMEASRNRWRTNTDDSHINTLNRHSGRTFRFIDANVEDYLKSCGYDTNAPNKSALIWALTNTTMGLNGMDELEFESRLTRAAQ